MAGQDLFRAEQAAQAQRQRNATAEEVQRRKDKRSRVREAAGRAPSTGLVDLPAPADGFIRLRTLDGLTVLEAELTAPVLPVGGGGHAPIERPGTSPVQSFTGGPNTVLPLPVTLDGWPTSSVQQDLETVRLFTGLGEREPPPLILEGRGIPYARHERPTWTWVLGPPEWGEQRPSADGRGAIVLQDVTLTATHQTRPSSWAVVNATTRRYHEVRKGARLVTLRRIAKHYKTSWTRLVALNPELPADVDRKLKSGTRVQLQ